MAVLMEFAPGPMSASASMLRIKAVAQAIPLGSVARDVARGISRTTGRKFNLAVAFDPSPSNGPFIAQSTFHHFSDYS